MSLLTGIHHVTAFAKSPRENVAFYSGVLGYRLVKKTVNFDDPLTYHLYYGDAAGTPGTLLTHFPQPRSKRGAHGTTEIRETRLAVAPGSMDAWRERLRAAGVPATVDDAVVRFADPDGMLLSLAEVEGTAPGSIGCVERVVVHVRELEPAVSFLREVLGFREVQGDAQRALLEVGRGGAGARLEIVEDGASEDLRWGAGIVHHVAWRVPDESAQLEVAERIRASRVGVTPVLDRKYFRSIYFRIPGGVVFEVATDWPGFDVDEPRDALGGALQLPAEHEGRRAEIERHLEPL